MNSAFEKLDERIQKAIKKFKLVQPTLIQQLSVDAILAGMNCLLISETGTGKTLAALLPVFHRWLKEKPKPVSILYITPMKALNRDMLDHLLDWGKELDMEVTVRHGDTSQYERKLQVEFPNDMMIVTLETLQPILTGKKIRDQLRNVKYVIVDECLPYDTMITLNDGSCKKIGELVEENLSSEHYANTCKREILVKSFDRGSGELVDSNILSVHKIPIHTDMIYLRTKFYNLELSTTSDHPILAVRNKKMKWLEAKDIKTSDKLVIFNPIGINATKLKKEVETPVSLVKREFFEYIRAKEFARLNKNRLVEKIKDLKKKGYKDVEIGRMLGFDKQLNSRGKPYKNHCSDLIRRLIRPTKKLLRGFPNFNEWEKLQGGGCLLDEIAVIKKEEDKPSFVYDLTVDKTHNFLANNIVVHNCHEIADSKRGVQLTLALERLRELCGDFQLIILSATIGQPEEVANFFSGGRVVNVIQAKTEKETEIKVIHPKPTLADRRIAKKIFTSVDTAARVRTIMELIKDYRSTLTFTNTRDFAEILTSRIRLIDKKFPVAIHHSSLSKEVRIKAEKQFKEEKLKSLVATSSLQLGVDIGSVELTIQYQSPREVTQLVQRVGRSGHALGRTSKGVVITTDDDDIFESAVIGRKALAGELDKITFHEKPYDVLAHQLVGLAFDFGKVSLEKAYEIVKRAWPYRYLSYPEFLEVCKQVERLGLIFLNGYLKRRRRSFDYYFSQLSTIPDIRQYRIFNTLDRSFVGVLDEEFVALHGEPNTTFIVKGEPWRIIAVEGDRVLVEPSSDVEAAVPGWEGELMPVPFEVAQEVGRLRGAIAERLRTEPEKVDELMGKYPVDKNCAKRMVDLVKKQAKFGAVPDDRTVLIEDFENLIILHACFGTKVNETIGRFLTTMLASRLGSVGLRTDPYRIMLQFQQKNVGLIKEVLNTKPEYFQSYLELGLSKSELFEWKFVHVAKRFGAISRNADFGKYTMKKIVEEYVGTPVYKETLHELETEKLDVEKSVEILKKIQSGEIKVVFKPGLSPLGKLGVKYKYAEIVGGKPEKEIFELFKQRLLNTKIKLVCMNCGKWEQSYAAGKVADTSCRKCGAKLLAVVRPEWKVLSLVRKGLKGRLTQEEKKRYERLRQRADLYLTYRNKAVLALAGRGIGPTTARRILIKFHKTDEELLKDILEAERSFIRTRRYWSS